MPSTYWGTTESEPMSGGMYDAVMRTHTLQEEVSIPSHEGRTLWAPGASGKSRGSQKMRLREEGTGWQKQERRESSLFQRS